MASLSGPSLRSTGADFLRGNLGRLAAVCVAAFSCAGLAQPSPSTIDARAAEPPGKPSSQTGDHADKPSLGSYDITMNSRATGMPVLAARGVGGRLWLDEAALRDWRVRLPGAERAEIDGVGMIRLDSVAGARFEIDERRQAIALYLDPGLLAGTRFGLTPDEPLPLARAPHWGSFLNYSLFGYSSGGDTDASGLFEAAVFGPRGNGLLSFGVNTAIFGGTTGDIVRYDTSWRRDEPESLRTMVIGDSISRAGFYGRPVRFGGIQYGKNFTLQPGFVSSPLIGLQGTAALPSTIDVFVNNQRIASQQVEPGPFAIDNVPAVSGSGTLQLVVRDAFGQQQVISESFYGSPMLLAPGLNDYAFSIGAQRRNFGIESGDYGGAQAMALWRRGLSSTLTVEARTEADETVASAGFAADVLVGSLAIASFGAAASSGDAGSGGLWLVGVDRQAAHYSFGVRGTFSSEDFRQVGDIAGLTTAERSLTARAALNLGAWGSVGAAAVSQRYHEPLRPDIDTGTLTWSGRLGKLANLSMSLTRSVGVRDDTRLFATISIPLGPGTTLSAGATEKVSGSPSYSRQSVSVVRSLPAYEEGYGYRLFADSDRRTEAGASLAMRSATLRAEIADAAGVTAARASIEGAVATVGGYTFLARPIVDSFAVVSAGGVPGIGVQQENQRAGKTDASGRLVLTPLRAYLPNKISLDPLSTPMGVAIGKSTQVVVPTRHSGLYLEFDVRRGRSALVSLLAPDGSPLSTAAQVTDTSSGRQLPVGMNGEVFLTGLPDAGTRLRIEIGGKDCEVDVRPEGDDPVLELGPYRCGNGT
jgi:outer membrane usher protein